MPTALRTGGRRRCRDPLIAAAIVFVPRPGLVAAIALMIVDVGVNVSANGGFYGWAIWLQSAFGLFVLAAAPYCWNRSANDGSAGRGERSGRAHRARSG